MTTPSLRHYSAAAIALALDAIRLAIRRGYQIGQVIPRELIDGYTVTPGADMAVASNRAAAVVKAEADAAAAILSEIEAAPNAFKKAVEIFGLTEAESLLPDVDQYPEEICIASDKTPKAAISAALESLAAHIEANWRDSRGGLTDAGTDAISSIKWARSMWEKDLIERGDMDDYLCGVCGMDTSYFLAA